VHLCNRTKHTSTNSAFRPLLEKLKRINRNQLTG